MANTPKKMKDPTEAALSAIQDALNVRDPAPEPAPASSATAAGHAAGRRAGVRAAMAHERARRASPGGGVQDDEVRASRGPGHVAPPGQRRPRVDRPDPALPAAPSGAHVLHRRDRVRGGLGAGRADARLDVPARPAGHARPDRPDRADARRAGADLLRADHLLLRARPHGLAVAGVAAHHPVDGRGRHAARRAGDGGARVDRHRRPGDPARGRRHGRRHRARAGARRRARDAGGERGVRARARLQRQRGAHPRRCCRIWAASATRWSARPSRSATPSTASISISATTFPRSASWWPSRSTRRRGASPTRWPRRASTSPARSAHAGDTMIEALGERGGDLLDRLERTSAGDRPGDRRRQRPADLDAQLQDRSHRRRVHRDHRQSAAHDVGAARPRDRGLRAEVGGDPRHDDQSLARSSPSSWSTPATGSPRRFPAASTK